MRQNLREGGRERARGGGGGNNYAVSRHSVIHDVPELAVWKGYAVVGVTNPAGVFFSLCAAEQDGV